MLSCEYFEIFQNTYFQEHLSTAVSVLQNIEKNFFRKTKKWQIKNSEKSEKSKISEKLF